MIRGTTPTHTFTLPFGADVIKSVRIVYAQDGDVKITKTGDDVTGEENTITTRLTQEDTLALDCTKTVEIQVRILTLGGDALSSDIIRTNVNRCLENEVLA